MGDRVTNIWKKESDGEENDVPWHLKYGGRVLGTFAGVGVYKIKYNLPSGVFQFNLFNYSFYE